MPAAQLRLVVFSLALSFASHASFSERELPAPLIHVFHHDASSLLTMLNLNAEIQHRCERWAAQNLGNGQDRYATFFRRALGSKPQNAVAIENFALRLQSLWQLRFFGAAGSGYAQWNQEHLRHFFGEALPVLFEGWPQSGGSEPPSLDVYSADIVLELFFDHWNWAPFIFKTRELRAIIDSVNEVFLDPETSPKGLQNFARTLYSKKKIATIMELLDRLTWIYDQLPVEGSFPMKNEVYLGQWDALSKRYLSDWDSESLTFKKSYAFGYVKNSAKLAEEWLSFTEWPEGDPYFESALANLYYLSAIETADFEAVQSSYANPATVRILDGSTGVARENLPLFQRAQNLSKIFSIAWKDHFKNMDPSDLRRQEFQENFLKWVRSLYLGQNFNAEPVTLDPTSVTRQCFEDLNSVWREITTRGPLVKAQVHL